MRDGSVSLEWAGQLHRFRLCIGELETVQEVCDCGPYELFDRLTVEDRRCLHIETIVCAGLRGGGVDNGQANGLFRLATSGGYPPSLHAAVAHRILHAACVGAVDEQIQPTKGKAEEPLPNGKMRFASFYGNGAAMGFTPQQVRQMSLWQFRAAASGYARANDAEAGKALSETEAAMLFDWL